MATGATAARVSPTRGTAAAASHRPSPTSDGSAAATAKGLHRKPRHAADDFQVSDACRRDDRRRSAKTRRRCHRRHSTTCRRHRRTAAVAELLLAADEIAPVAVPQPHDAVQQPAVAAPQTAADKQPAAAIPQAAVTIPQAAVTIPQAAAVVAGFHPMVASDRPPFIVQPMAAAWQSPFLWSPSVTWLLAMNQDDRIWQHQQQQHFCGIAASEDISEEVIDAFIASARQDFDKRKRTIKCYKMSLFIFSTLIYYKNKSRSPFSIFSLTKRPPRPYAYLSLKCPPHILSPCRAVRILPCTKLIRAKAEKLRDKVLTRWRQLLKKKIFFVPFQFFCCANSNLRIMRW